MTIVCICMRLTVANWGRGKNSNGGGEGGTGQLPLRPLVAMPLSLLIYAWVYFAMTSFISCLAKNTLPGVQF